MFCNNNSDFKQYQFLALFFCLVSQPPHCLPLYMSCKRTEFTRHEFDEVLVLKNPIFSLR